MDWKAIVEEHGPLVWRTAYRLLGNEADAADCYQEAFAAALAVSQRENVRNWPGMLRKLATVHGLDRLRRRCKERALASTDSVDAVPAGGVGPSRIAQENELIEWLRGVLAEMPEMQARVFWLTCVERFSYQEAATELEIDIGHVGVLLHRARGRLRELLASVAEDMKG